jgi:hypothetical protein
MSVRRPLSMWAPRRQDGAASVEFFVVFIVAITLIMAVLQMGMFMIAKNTVNLATFAAARAGAASGGDVGEMKKAFAQALSGLYVAKGLRLAGSNGLTDVSSGNFQQVATGATAYAFAAASLPTNEIKILNPTREAFTDFGVPNPNGTAGRIIPATGLLTDTAVGAASQQTRADALLLKIRVRHCYEITMPLIGEAISKVYTDDAPMSPPPPENVLCMLEHPLPDGRMAHGVMIESEAVVRMTAPAIESNF